MTFELQSLPYYLVIGIVIAVYTDRRANALTKHLAEPFGVEVPQPSLADRLEQFVLVTIGWPIVIIKRIASI